MFIFSAAESSSRSRSWGWGGWGSMISKATTSVSTMLESVETKLGIPNPADMAKIVTEEEQKEKKDEQPSPKVCINCNAYISLLF